MAVLYTVDSGYSLGQCEGVPFLKTVSHSYSLYLPETASLTSGV